SQLGGLKKELDRLQQQIYMFNAFMANKQAALMSLMRLQCMGINDMTTTNKRTPPAIIKLNIVIPKMLRISVPPTANIMRTVPEAIMAVFETAFRSSFSIFSVIAIKRGTVPIGLSTTNRAIVDLSRSLAASGPINNLCNRFARALVN
ncbi:MAG: hypothetical protein WAK17_30285, partial [Candidatus Nitrosopolaris sp.]